MAIPETEPQLSVGHLLKPADVKSRFSDELNETLRTGPEPSLSLNQQLVLALATRGYDRFDTNTTTTERLCTAVLFFAVIVTGTYWVSFFAFAVLLPFDWLVVTAVVAFHLVTALHLVMKRYKLSMEDNITMEIDLHKRGDRLCFGHLNDVLNSETISGWICAAGICVGLQTVLLTTTDMGEPRVDGFVDSILVTTNNLCHGALLDVMEMYHLNIGPELGVLPFWPATMFLGFRIMCDGLLILTALNVWRIHRANQLFDSFPGQLHAASLDRWVHSLSNHRTRLDRSYPDEVIFSFVIKEYVLGHHDVVLATCEQFGSLPVSDEVRSLFVHPDTGQQLFAMRHTILA